VQDNTNVDPLKPTIPLRELFPHRCNDAVFGLDMYKTLKESKVTFNVHADETGNSVANLRLFEATGVGTCLLTDTRGNMSDLFEAEKEVVTYSSVDEAVEKVKYLLDHEDERQAIAKAGQDRTLKDHTIINRCQRIDAAIQEKL
jgi:spore maturation protein CgeB